jgi:hypothetical protein
MKARHVPAISLVIAALAACSQTPREPRAGPTGSAKLRLSVLEQGAAEGYWRVHVALLNLLPEKAEIPLSAMLVDGQGRVYANEFAGSLLADFMALPADSHWKIQADGVGKLSGAVTLPPVGAAPIPAVLRFWFRVPEGAQPARIVLPAAGSPADLSVVPVSPMLPPAKIRPATSPPGVLMSVGSVARAVEWPSLHQTLPEGLESALKAVGPPSDLRAVRFAGYGGSAARGDTLVVVSVLFKNLSQSRVEHQLGDVELTSNIERRRIDPLGLQPLMLSSGEVVHRPVGCWVNGLLSLGDRVNEKVSVEGGSTVSVVLIYNTGNDLWTDEYSLAWRPSTAGPEK